MTRLDDEGVVLHLAEGRYFTLNDTGATLIEALTVAQDTDELTRLLCLDFDVTPDVAHATVLIFIDECLDARLVLREP